jgi:hypothetical protein
MQFIIAAGAGRPALGTRLDEPSTGTHGNARSGASIMMLALSLDDQTISMSANSLDSGGLMLDGNSLRLRVIGGSADGLTLMFTR